MLLSLFDDRCENVRGKTIGLAALLLAANLGAWGWAFAAFGDEPLLLGAALLAYVFGLRHAVDADHIAAIDNVVRKLMQEKKRPLSVGFFFSLGHSTVVVLAAVAIAATAAALQGEMGAFGEIGGLVGTAVSSAFLLLIAVANLFILRGVWRSFQRVRAGLKIGEEDLNHLLAGGGLLSRLFGPVLRSIRRSWQMYPLGFLFGLGFDTATEIGLLGISATQAAQGLSLWNTLVFSALFTAGMALVDFIDNVLMVGAYGWAFVNPLRKLWYNLTITAVSVVVAVLIGGLQALGLIAEKLGLEGGFWGMIRALSEEIGAFGLAVIGIFVAGWALSAIIYKWKGYGRLAVEGR